MTSTAILGPLSAIHETMRQLLLSVPAADASRQYHPQLGSLAWHLGRGVYLETYWLREILAGDKDLSSRVARLLTPGALPLSRQCAELPPPHHLLNWALEIQDEHLTRLANPGYLPSVHPLLRQDRLQWFLLQEQARQYEYMLMVLGQRALASDTTDYQVRRLLEPQWPSAETGEVIQGHYRVGSRRNPAAYDNELPPQAVNLGGFRIARHPVSNAEYLLFMESDGYDTKGYWTAEGHAWLRATDSHHPQQWRRDRAGNWYGIGLGGAADLPPDEPVTGIGQHESRAYAAWVSTLRDETLRGAVVQHEYQWEVAARTGVIGRTGRAWEWCANAFHPYPEFQPFPSPDVSAVFFDRRHWSQRGGSLHTQRVLRRTSVRHWGLAEQRFGFTGTRLVFPPGPAPWEEDQTPSGTDGARKSGNASD